MDTFQISLARCFWWLIILFSEYIDQKAADTTDFEDIEKDFKGYEVETCSDNNDKYFKVGYSFDGATLSESSKHVASILDENNYD